MLQGLPIHRHVQDENHVGNSRQFPKKVFLYKCILDTNSTYKAIIWLPIFKYDESRQCLYSVLISNARVFLSINFHHLDLVFQRSTDFVEDRNHELTRATPGNQYFVTSSFI